MRNITISKLIRLWGLSCLLVFATTGISWAQQSEGFVNVELQQQPCYANLPKVFYIAVLPVNSCFSCEAMLNAQVKSIVKEHTIVIIYPATRKIVQDKIKRENKIDLNKAIYIFDDVLYQKLYDAKKPKGYTLKVRK